LKTDYEVFISFKNTEEGKDKEIANKIYEHLKKYGIKVFFEVKHPQSERTALILF
jgi:hypothetical protein